MDGQGPLECRLRYWQLRRGRICPSGAASPMFVVMGVEGSHQRRGSMEYGTFKLWLIERGCRFDTQPKQRGEGHGAGGPRSYC
jgi:hypothetical protein